MRLGWVESMMRSNTVTSAAQFMCNILSRYMAGEELKLRNRLTRVWRDQHLEDSSRRLKERQVAEEAEQAAQQQHTRWERACDVMNKSLKRLANKHVSSAFIGLNIHAADCRSDRDNVLMDKARKEFAERLKETKRRASTRLLRIMSLALTLTLTLTLIASTRLLRIMRQLKWSNACTRAEAMDRFRENFWASVLASSRQEMCDTLDTHRQKLSKLEKKSEKAMNEQFEMRRRQTFIFAKIIINFSLMYVKLTL